MVGSFWESKMPPTWGGIWRLPMRSRYSTTAPHATKPLARRSGWRRRSWLEGDTFMVAITS